MRGDVLHCLEAGLGWFRGAEAAVVRDTKVVLLLCVEQQSLESSEQHYHRSSSASDIEESLSEREIWKL